MMDKIKEIAIISGKGGTGKTSVTAALSECANPIVVADCDVDASNLPIILNPESEIKTEEYFGGFYATVDKELCSSCGICEVTCRFDAIHFGSGDKPWDRYPDIHFYSCEGCGACVDVCPTGALKLLDRKSGALYESTMRYGPIVYAELDVGEGTSGKLVSLVRRRATEVAQNAGMGIVLIDGSPGIGCPVIASITGATAVAIVSEPSVSGLHDLDRISQLTNHFNIPAGLIINKHDLNPEMTKKMEEASLGKGIKVIGKIGYDRIWVDSMVQGKTVLEYTDNSGLRENIQGIWTQISELAEL